MSQLITPEPSFIKGGGEAGEFIRSFNWSTTPLGEINGWPQSLKTVVSVCLHSKFASLLLWGKELVMLYNDAFMPVLGTGHPAAMGATCREGWPEVWKTVGAVLQDVLERGEGASLENQQLVLTRNGFPEECYFTFSFSPVYDETGGAGGVFCAITETTGAVLNKHESHTLLNALMDATLNVVYRMSSDWKEMRELGGRDFLSDTRAPNNAWMQKYIDPRDQDRVWQKVNEAIKNKSVFELEHQVIRADGSLGWTFLRAIPIFNDNNEIIEWFGAATDITERKRFEEVLKEAKDDSEKQKRLYEAITRSTPDLIYVFDLDYHFTYANEALLTMWGRSWNDSIGKKLLEVGYEPWHAEMHEREIDHVVATKTSIRGTVSFPHATLGKRIYDYIFVPVVNEKGDVEAVAGTTRDITEIKRAEESLKQNEEKLEKLVTERTKELQRSNEDLQQFAHVASHDLKEPVRKIIIFGNRLQQEFGNELPPKAKDFLSKIQAAANRMTSMIDGVLLYSSLNGKEKEMEAVNLNEVLNHIKTDLELVISQKNALINYENLPTIFGSSLLIYQLFYNLLNNSLKFARPGVDPVINIDAEPEKDGKFARVIVQDNGIGFNPAQSEMIFKTFTRLHAKDEYEGTGLGLALCKKIAERHNGRITATGTVNEGAVFTVSLPLSEKAEI